MTTLHGYLKEFIKEEYIEDILKTYEHINKLSTLKLLALKYQEVKEEEFELNKKNKYMNHFSEMYPILSGLKKIKKISVELQDKLNALPVLEADKLFLENKKDSFIKLIIDAKYAQFEYTMPFRKDVFGLKYEIKFKNAKTLSEMEMLANEFYEGFENKIEDYKKQYKEKESKLKNIVNADSIENYYPIARSVKRNVTAYLGPTNSGKTHNAINRLKEAKKGIYLAPLRLLAREIYDDLIEAGVKASLITGEERIIHPEGTHVCSTIEMLDIKEKYDLAIIDEIQFLGDMDRGSAWSKAFLGLAAREIIVIGSTDSEGLIRHITNLCKDTLDIKKFTRLSELEILQSPITVNDLQKGDAIIAFSRRDVHSITEELTVKHNKKVSLIYGALPPEVRIEESRRFNDGETDILVSTDAIGYGLNLNIKRVLYTTVSKFNGYEMLPLDQSQFNQISGRAGRFGKYEKGEVGFINGFTRKYYDYNEFKSLSDKFSEPLREIKQAYFFPEWEALRDLSDETGTKNSMLKLLSEFGQIFKNKNFIFRYDFLITLNYLDSLEMDLEAKYKVMFAPVRENTMSFFERCMEAVIDGKPYETDMRVQLDRARTLEDLELVSHKALLYMWMSQRNRELFPSYEKVVLVYNEISEQIIELLKEGY